MNLLAIETATEFCSAALSINGALACRGELAPRRHAELLLPMCESLLAEAGLNRIDIDVVAVGRGPGAFTGVRLAIAAAQGIALARDVPVVPVSSLAALAMQAPDNGAMTLAVIDARMGEVYAACYMRNAQGLMDMVGEETVGASSALRLADGARWNAIGTGWASDGAVIGKKMPAAPIWAAAERYPHAADVARLALPQARDGLGVAAELALPIYLRDKVALTLVEQRADKAAASRT